jgi:hypothetical protein
MTKRAMPRQTFEIVTDVASRSKKPRAMKYPNDALLAQLAIDIKNSNPDVKINRIVKEILEKLPSSSDDDFEKTKRRIVRRIKIFNNNAF